MIDYYLLNNDNYKNDNGTTTTSEASENQGDKKKPKNSAAKIRANNKYTKKTYNHIAIYIKKTEMYKIETVCKSFGEITKSAAVNRLIDEEYQRLTESLTETETETETETAKG